MMPSVLPLMRAAASEEGGGFDIPSMILHHLADSHEWETPFGVVQLPQFDPVQIGINIHVEAGPLEQPPNVRRLIVSKLQEQRPIAP